MPKMRNISQRQFVIAGKTLKQGETGEFPQSVIDRHVASYAGELEAVAGEVEQKAPIKEETPPVVAENETTETVADNATVEETVEVKADSPKKYPSQMNKKELKEYLTEKGIPFPADASAKDLKELAK